MALPRVFADADRIAGQEIELNGEPFHHLAVVLRRTVGDRFYAIDPTSGAEHLIEILTINDRTIRGRILERVETREQPAMELTLYQGLPKGKRFPLILQKCTELGVARIVPVLTGRSVVRLDGQAAADKLTRWAKIVQEAARQSMRPTPPQVTEPMQFAEAVADWRASGKVGLFFDEGLAGDQEHTLTHAMAELGLHRELAVFVGPEGGFTAQEAQTATDAGLVSVSLGNRILRTETAAIVACAIVMYECGELG